MTRAHVLNTYARFDITLQHGKGCLVYDDQGKEYIDFVSGVAVNCLGHSHPAIAKTLSEQSKKLLHVSNLYWNEKQMALAEQLCSSSGMNGAFFCNSGTEAVEAALKFARKYGKVKGGDGKSGIIYMDNSFHGRTMGALSVTGQAKYQKDYMPLLPCVQSAVFNDAESLKQVIDEQTCAVIVEPVQGEGGVVNADPAFLQEVRALCDQYDAVLIFDEVQCGIGRLGSLFAFEKYDVKPDIVCLAKGLGGGFPIGAAVVNEKIAEVVKPGDHGSTFGGNLLASTVALTVLEELLEKGVLANVNAMNLYFAEKLETLKAKHAAVTGIQGMGLLLGIKLSIDPKTFINKCVEKGLLLVGAGADVVRLLPPLNIEPQYIDQAVAIMDAVLAEKNI